MSTRTRTSADDLIRVSGPLLAHEMASAIVKTGAVRRMYHADIERCLKSVEKRSPEGTTFTEAGIPPGWPGRGNLFVVDNRGKRWRIHKDADAYGGFYIKIQEQKAKVHP